MGGGAVGPLPRRAQDEFPARLGGHHLQVRCADAALDGRHPSTEPRAKLLHEDDVSTHTSSVANVDYFRSERFIHDDLANRAARIADEVREDWKKNHQVAPFAVTWPETSLRSDDGGSVEGAVLCRLPQLTHAQQHDVLKRMVEKTKAYGLVLVRPSIDRISVLFETRHGARAWTMQLERHGDVTVCMDPVVANDGECVGLLWQPRD